MLKEWGAPTILLYFWGPRLTAVYLTRTFFTFENIMKMQLDGLLRRHNTNKYVSYYVIINSKNIISITIFVSNMYQV